MAIAELTGQRNSSAAGAVTNISVVYPSSPTQGNLMVACLSWRGDTTISGVPSGWNLAAAGGNGSGIDSAIYRKIAGASEGTTHTFTLAASNKCALVASEWSGIAPSPLDATNANTGTGTAGTCGLTGPLAQADELVVCLFSNINTATWSSYDNSAAEVLEATTTGGAATTRNTVAMSARVVSATTSINYGATLTASQIWSSAVATFKGQADYTVTGRTSQNGAVTAAKTLASASVVGKTSQSGSNTRLKTVADSLLGSLGSRGSVTAVGNYVVPARTGYAVYTPSSGATYIAETREYGEAVNGTYLTETGAASSPVTTSSAVGKTGQQGAATGVKTGESSLIGRVVQSGINAVTKIVSIAAVASIGMSGYVAAGPVSSVIDSSAAGVIGISGSVASGKVSAVAISGIVGTSGQDTSAKTGLASLDGRDGQYGSDSAAKTALSTVNGESSASGQNTTTNTALVSVVGDIGQSGQLTAAKSGESTIAGSAGNSGAVTSNKTASASIQSDASAYGQSIGAAVNGNELSGSVGQSGSVAAGKTGSGSVTADASGGVITSGGRLTDSAIVGGMSIGGSVASESNPAIVVPPDETPVYRGRGGISPLPTYLPEKEKFAESFISGNVGISGASVAGQYIDKAALKRIKQKHMLLLMSA